MTETNTEPSQNLLLSWGGGGGGDEASLGSR